MDCVGCDKCRLWGKVQVTGLAAAMKVLFEMDDKALEYVPYPAVCVCDTELELSRHLQPAAESEFVVSMGGCSFTQCPPPIQREFARDREFQADVE